MSILNKEQQEAVNHLRGPLLLIAGAGSGKTRVLIERIANIIRQGLAQPDQILAVTFTNKAARELKDRLVALIGEEGKFVLAGTFHSICVRILRLHCDKIGYERNFVIYDADDSERLLKEIIKTKDINIKEYPPKKVGSIISRLKNKLIYPNKAMNATDSSNDVRYRQVLDIYEIYQKELRKNNAFDFDDLICKTIELFESSEDILMEYQNRLMYLHVDEYQDTNYVQDRLVELMSGLYQNICVVGDEDQAIYSWRGADIKNILDFSKKYPKCHVIQLEQNYRSTQNILDVANAVIKKNEERLGKNLFTQSKSGESVRLISSDSDTYEGMKISEIVSDLSKGGENLRDIAILYRANYQSRAIEKYLRVNGFSYQVYGGVKFYSRKEIKDLTAYLKIIVNPADSVSLERIINFPTRGIGAASIKKLKQFAFIKTISLFDAINEDIESIGVSKKALNGLKKFYALIKEAQELNKTKNAVDVTEFIFEKSGLKDFYTAFSEKEDSSEIENLYEFLADVADFTESSDNNTLMDYLETVSLMSDIDSYNENEDSLTLMTVHSSKGLEFDNVIIAGLNEFLFPNSRTIEDGKIEEERRLFYVAVTRAKKKLWLSTYRFSRGFGDNAAIYSPSRFIGEIPQELLNRVDFDGSSQATPTNVPYRLKSVEKEIVEDFQKGDWVVSEQFGEGKVVLVEGEGKKKVLTIDFDDYGLKKLLLSYAKLKRLDT